MNSGIIGAPYYGGVVVRTSTADHVIDVQLVVDDITDSLSADPDLDYLGSLIDQVWGSFAQDVKLPILQQTAYLHKFTGKGGRSHAPRLFQINSISKLERWDEPTLTWVEITDGYYGDDTDSIWQIWYRNGFCNGHRYRATLDVGFSTLPDDLVEYVKDATVEKFYDSVQGEKRFQMASEADSVAGVSGTKTYDRKKLASRRLGLIGKYSMIGG